MGSCPMPRRDGGVCGRDSGRARACERCRRRVAEARARAEGRRVDKRLNAVPLDPDSPMLDKVAFDAWWHAQ